MVSISVLILGAGFRRDVLLWVEDGGVMVCPWSAGPAARRRTFLAFLSGGSSGRGIVSSPLGCDNGSRFEGSDSGLSAAGSDKDVSKSLAKRVLLRLFTNSCPVIWLKDSRRPKPLQSKFRGDESPPICSNVASRGETTSSG